MAARTTALSGTVNWSNGLPFDGYVLIGMVLPSGYASACPVSAFPVATLPVFTTVPITAGAFNQSATLYYNADLEPPNVRYAAYWYDVQDKLLSGPSALFDIAASPYAITVPTLTAAAAGSSAPAPPA